MEILQAEAEKEFGDSAHSIEVYEADGTWVVRVMVNLASGEETQFYIIDRDEKGYWFTQQ